MSQILPGNFLLEKHDVFNKIALSEDIWIPFAICDFFTTALGFLVCCTFLGTKWYFFTKFMVISQGQTSLYKYIQH